MLVDVKTGNARMSRADEAAVRAAAARNGYLVNMSTGDECLDAIIKALPAGVAGDLLQFLETGSSELTSCASVADFQRKIGQLSR